MHVDRFRRTVWCCVSYGRCAGVIWGESQTQQDERLHTVLARIEKASITLNLEKCELGRQEGKFLGHIITESGVRRDPEKVRAVMQMKEPSTGSEVRSFLGMKEEEQWKPVAYASRSLSPTKQRYAQVEKEALGLTWGCERFKDFLIGHHFHLETDHKPLVCLLGIQELAEFPQRIQRFRMRLMRTTPLPNGYSPAQLLMGRRLRTPIPQHHSLLIPSLPDFTTVAAKEKEIREKQAASYNIRHRARQLSHLSSGQRVWITDTKTEGTVVASHSAPRSYLVESPQGTIRRNRHHLVPMASTDPCAESFPETGDQTEEGEHSPESSTAQTVKTPMVHKTRSGRTVVQPKRLDL
ncbi:hypothetical protein QQF64_003392 [Cirrhinus molitorella]|uniref:Reverse transcriptase RNase H-like domain-containing protein n=1 Tax=Cirrhinus molitorella TaxID=172907 RepID=A0ABR3ML59_9TELE